MRILLSVLIIVSGLAVGCASHKQSTPKPGDVVVAQPNAAAPAPVVDDGLPPADSHLTTAQIKELRARLSKLQVGMARDQVLEILNLSSFNVRSYVSRSTSGLTYHIQNHHVLDLKFQPGDYDYRLVWAKFDTFEAYPRAGTPHAPPLGPTP